MFDIRRIFGPLQRSPVDFWGLLFSLDWPFVSTKRTGPGEATRAALQRVWTRPEHADLADALRPPVADWEAINRSITALVAGETTASRSPADWTQLALASERLAEQEPIAGVVVALYAMGGIGQSGSVHQRLARDWYPIWGPVPLALVRNLVRADAIWAGSAMANYTVDAITAQRRYFTDERAQADVAAYGQALAACERRHDGCIRDLAWELRAAYGLEPPNLRAELAAVAWALGDVPHARLLADGAEPSLPVLQDLIEQSLRRIPVDPFVQMIWLQLKDRPFLDFRRHLVLFTFINNVFGGSSIHLVDSGSHMVPGLGAPLSEVWAESLTAWLGRRSTAEHRKVVGLCWMYLRQPLLLQDATFAVRLGALHNLVNAPDEDAAQAGWRSLCDLACQVQRTLVQQGVFDIYDLSLAVPFHYLRADSATELEANLAWIERSRCTGLWYWLTVTPPGRQPGAPEPAPFERERHLLDELRGIRFLQLLPYLPIHYRYTEFAHGTPSWEELLDRDRSIARLTAIDQELGTLQDAIAAVDPAYARRRRDPQVTLDEFAAALPAAAPP
jgi:hypothetical protein